MQIKKIITVFTASALLFCGCSNNENSETAKDMSCADTPEIMVCRIIDAVASNDEQAYNLCYPGKEASYNQSYDDVHSSYAMECREFGVDYEKKRSAEDFNIYIFNDMRDTEGSCSFIAYLEDSELIKLHIKTQFDTDKNQYRIDEIIPRKAGETGAKQSNIKKKHELIDIENIDYK